MCRVENSAVHSRLCVCLSEHRDLSPQTARLRKVCFLPPSVASCNCILQPTYAAVRCSSCAALTRGSDPAGLKDTALRAGLFTRMGVRSAQRRRHAPPVPRDCRAHWRTGAGNARDTGVAAQLPAARFAPALPAAALCVASRREAALAAAARRAAAQPLRASRD